jgi:hypothetical protein
MHLCFLCKIEQKCHLRTWEDIPQVLKVWLIIAELMMALHGHGLAQEVAESNTSISIETFEAISDMLVRSQ